MPDASPAAISPGTYLRKRRDAAGLSRDDVALRTETVPAVSARTRAEWLAAIEADAAPISVGTAVTLYRCFRFDPHVLDALMAIHAGADDVAAPHLCRVCACSARDACVDQVLGGTCAWIDAAETLCTSCVDVPEQDACTTTTFLPIDPDQALAKLTPEIVSVSTSAMLIWLGLLNTPLGREELAEILKTRGWTRNGSDFWCRPRSSAIAA